MRWTCVLGLCCAIGCSAEPDGDGTSFGSMGETPTTTTGTPDPSTTTGAESSTSTTAAADSSGSGGSSEDSGSDSTSGGSSSSTGGCADPLTIYADTDEDGFGDPDTAVESCELLEGFVEDGTDCDDTQEGINPSITELCDGTDNNCNDVVDEFSLQNDACDDCTLTERNGSVYWFCEGPVNRFDARDFCTDHGADLTSISDLPEDAFVRENVAGPRDWFIGLEDIDQEGTYVWSDGADTNYFAWAVGEPNNIDDENCVELALEDDWGWNDTNCENEQGFVCEANPDAKAKR